MENRLHGFHHVSNNTLPQSNAARILIKTNQHYLTRYQGHGLIYINHGQPWFNLNVPLQARVYEIYTLKFAFEVRWLHGTCMYICMYVCMYVNTYVYMYVLYCMYCTVCTCVHVFVTYVRIFVCMYVHMYVQM